MNILVVDDEQDICEILQFNLVTEGYSVVTANSAEEALRTIASEIIMGDHEVARYIGEDGVAAYRVACYCLPIVFMMGNAIV